MPKITPFAAAILILIPVLFTGPSSVPGAWAATEAETALEMERLKLEIERLKLENQRLELKKEQERLSAPAPEKSGKDGDPGKDRKTRELDVSDERARQSADLAAERAGETDRMVFDFTNGEFWYKGIRHSMNDMAEFLATEGVPAKREMVKRSGSGDARYRYAYRNIQNVRYKGRERGVFVWEAPDEKGGFQFVVPEGFASEAPYSEVRNLFESGYFTYDKQKKKDDLRILRFKHKAGRFKWADKLNFWFDKDDRLVKVEWGVLDEN